jgi:hypothetical protein
MAQRPKKVTINESEYKIVSRSKEWKEKHKAFGRMHYTKPLIEIANHEGDHKELVDTFLHELAHGLIHECNIDVDGRQEEKLVIQFSNAWTSLFMDNPKVLEWLLHMQKKISK